MQKRVFPVWDESNLNWLCVTRLTREAKIYQFVTYYQTKNYRFAANLTKQRML